MVDLICAIPLIAGLVGRCAQPAPLATGYVEGEYVQLAPLFAARIDSIAVRRGQRIAPGDIVAQVETADARDALSAAESRLRRAEAELADLTHGSRPEELAALEATLQAAQARADQAEADAARAARLAQRGTASTAQADTLRTAADVARGAASEAEARLQTARLPARDDRLAAASAAVAEARAAEDSARWQLDQRSLRAASAGTVTDIIRNPGEMAGPSAPVLTYLPDGAVRLRVFVPEPALASVSVGAPLAVSCDGCPPLSARVSWIADSAEFTPPVIYSREARAKLVYMVEAVPEPGAPLKPGQIVDVRPGS